MRKFDRQRRGSVLLGSVLSVVVAVSACSDSQTALLDVPAPAFTVGFIPGNGQQGPNVGQAEIEAFEVCKDYSGGTSRDPVTIEVLIAPHEGSGPTPNPFAVELDDGECRDVWNHGGSGEDVVTVTENPVPDGYTVSYVKTVIGPDNSAGSGTNGASGIVNGPNGVLVVFTNTIIPIDFDGCTPGYWKNHAGADSHSRGGRRKPSSWQGFNPTELFDTVFGVTSNFPGGTLIDALNRGGGGENALGRHAVAALLSAAHSGVDYPLTTTEVISAVQAAYASGDFETTKNMLAELNEQGCPL